MEYVPEVLPRSAQRLADALSELMLRAGITPPKDELLVRAVLASAIVFILSLAYAAFLLFSARRDKRDTVLIAGSSGADDNPSVGKTTLFKVLRNGDPPQLTPVPSMEPNEAVFPPRAARAAPATRAPTSVRWVDFPGHARVRPRLTEYLEQARCVVFVVDASRFAQDARRDAAFLYDILVHPAVERYSTPVLVFCNKSEATGAVSPAAVRARLQAELERARGTKKSGLAEVNADDEVEGEGGRQLGFDNVPFVFDHAHGPVSFSSGSALKNDVVGVVNFVRSSFL